MRKLLLLLLCIISIQSSTAQNLPDRSNRLVSDFTGTLSSQENSQLEQKLLAYNDSTSTQVAVVIVKSTEGYDIADYATRLASKWGIGQKDRNNGVLLLVAMEDRSITIQTGYGMEGVLPDAICKRIIEQELKPEFRSGNYYAGIDKATTAIFKFAAGEYKADHYKKEKDSVPVGLIVVAVILFIYIVSRNKKNGGGGGFGSRGRSIPPIWFGGSGGSWGNFSGGGGGFGGFGGGGFGGGGASGRW